MLQRAGNLLLTIGVYNSTYRIGASTWYDQLVSTALTSRAREILWYDMHGMSLPRLPQLLSERSFPILETATFFVNVHQKLTDVAELSYITAPLLRRLLLRNVF